MFDMTSTLIRPDLLYWHIIQMAFSASLLYRLLHVYFSSNSTPNVFPFFFDLFVITCSLLFYHISHRTLTGFLSVISIGGGGPIIAL